MAEELGKIEKPSVESFTSSRKVVVVPLVYSGKDAPEDFQEIFSRCWQQINDTVSNLEAKLGSISKIYHEMIFTAGNEGLEVLEQLNPHSHQFVQTKSEAGAQLQATEDAELAMEHMDWERCLMVAMGNTVRNKIIHFHTESTKKRYDNIQETITKTLGEGEIGLLFVREGHSIQFPREIEVFNVYPPALDEINRWLRDYAKRIASEPPENDTIKT